MSCLCAEAQWEIRGNTILILLPVSPAVTINPTLALHFYLTTSRFHLGGHELFPPASLGPSLCPWKYPGARKGSGLLKITQHPAGEWNASFPCSKILLWPGGGTASFSGWSWWASCLTRQHSPQFQFDPCMPSTTLGKDLDDLPCSVCATFTLIAPSSNEVPIRPKAWAIVIKCTLVQHFVAPKIPVHLHQSLLVPVFPCLPSQTYQKKCVDAPNKCCVMQYCCLPLTSSLSTSRAYPIYLQAHRCFSSAAVKLCFIHRIKMSRACQVLYLAAES